MRGEILLLGSNQSRAHTCHSEGPKAQKNLASPTAPRNFLFVIPAEAGIPIRNLSRHPAAQPSYNQQQLSATGRRSGMERDLRKVVEGC